MTPLPPMSKIHDSLIEARLQGYSWSQIHGHMADAYAAGASREQLGYAPTRGFTDRMHFSMAGGMSAGGVQVAAAANENSPFAWVQGRRPVTEGGSVAAGEHVSIPPSSIGVDRSPKGPAWEARAKAKSAWEARSEMPEPTKLGVTETNPQGGKWSAQVGDTISGKMRPTEDDKYNQAVRQTKTANTRSPEFKDIEDLHEQRPFTTTEMNEMSRLPEEE